MESFKKRQKEMQRQERQRDKAARRMERKLQRASGADSEIAPASSEPEHTGGESPSTEPAGAR